MNLEKALSIDGWMSEPDLSWLAERAGSHQVIVEIGSYLGRSTRAMVDNTAGLIIAIDDWYGPRDVQIPDYERRTIMDRFLQNFSDIGKDRLQYVRVDHHNLTDKMPLITPDMIFIDGDHAYESVQRDLKWATSVMKHGLLCGHDQEYPSVRRALFEFFPSFRRATDFDSSIWWREL